MPSTAAPMRRCARWLPSCGSHVRGIFSRSFCFCFCGALRGDAPSDTQALLRSLIPLLSQDPAGIGPSETVSLQAFPTQTRIRCARHTFRLTLKPTWS